MRYDDASHTNIGGTGSTGPLAAHNDFDVIPAHSHGPATGNTITGAGTLSGAAGADALGAGLAHITAIQGAGGADSSLSGGHLMVSGKYGVLSITPQGDYHYTPKAGAPDGVTDTFSYTLTDKAGEHSIAQLAIRLEADMDKLAKAEQVVVGPDGVVVLPAGVTLEDVHVIGRNLVIDMPDGTQKVIVDGAVFVPQLVLDGVEVPSTTLASLLIDSEPQPAAGPPQSSGGNFETPVPPLDPGVPLGDLIPPTQMGYEPPTFRETYIPQKPNEIDHIPTIVIEPRDETPGALNADDEVREEGLPSRAGPPAESEGSHSADNSEATFGTILVTSLDNPTTITIQLEGGGPAIPLVAGAVITTDHSVLTILTVNGGTITYSYLLTDNTSGDTTQDKYDISVTDHDGDNVTGTLTIHIVDDVPTARDDTDSINQNNHATGNVMTGADTNEGAGGSGTDTQGADGAHVTGVTATGHTSTANGDGSFTIQGAHGTLTIFPDGHYDYTYVPNGAAGGGSDVFTYTITDGDGDPSHANLSITLPDNPPMIHVVDYLPEDAADNRVFENLLPARTGEPEGSAFAGGGDPTAAGDITFNSLDGVQSITLTPPGGSPVTLTAAQLAGGSNTVVDNSQYTLVVSGYTYDPATGNGTLHYVFTLNDNTIGNNAVQGGDTLVDFGVTITDLDNDPASDTLTIRVVDDHPTAVADTDTISDGGTAATGNVITDAEADGGKDTQGADSAQVTDVAGFGGSTDGRAFGAADVDMTVNGQYGILTIHADGSYSYSLYTAAQNQAAYDAIKALGDGAHVNDTFNYTITDGDGDTASTTLTIEVDGINDAPVANPDTNWVQEDTTLVATGNVLIDGSHPGDPSPVLSFADQGDTDIDSGTTLAVSNPGVVPGTYGTLVLNANGSYSYTLYTQAQNPAAYEAVQQLSDGETLQESFPYTTSDGSLTDGSTLTVTIFGANDPVTITGLNVEGGEEVVYEENLAAGSNPNAPALTQTGSFSFDAKDGLGATGSLTLGGHTLIDGTTLHIGETITTASGTLTITNIVPTYGTGGSIIGGTISYSYVLQNAVGEPSAGKDSIFDSFPVVVTDHDGSTGNDSLDIRVVDDVPTAHADTDSISLGGSTTDGNVITGAGTDGGLGGAGADVKGADGATVSANLISSVFAPGNPVTLNGDGSYSVHGHYGTLTMFADGHYTYVRDSGSPGNVSDQFNYTLKDGDNDVSSTTLTINIADAPVTIDIPVAGGATTTVYESGLPARPGEAPGSNQAANTEQVSGNINFSAPDGLGSVTIAGTTLNLAGAYPQTVSTNSTGTLVITGVDFNSGTGAGTVHYTYTMADNTLTDPSSVSFSVDITDTDGDHSPAGNLVIAVIDDHPTAVDDPLQTVAEDGANIGGNVLTNDTQGADSAHVNQISFDNITYVDITTGTNLGGGVFQFTNSHGVYTINAAGVWTFDPALNQANGSTPTDASFWYKIVDGDTDTSTAKQPINVTDGAGPGDSAPANLTLNEAALDTTQGGSDLAAGTATGTNPGLTTETQVVAPASGLSFTAGSDNLTSVAFNASQAGIVVTGLTAGYSLTWAINGSNQLVGTLHQGATNLGTAVIVQLTGDTGSTAAGSTAHVGVTATLVGPLSDTGAQITINGIDVIASQADGDTGHGAVNITVLDDAPVAANDGNLATLDDNASNVTIGTVAGILGNDNYGADGQGSPNITIGTGSLGGTVSIVGGNLVYTSAHNTTPGNSDVETFTYTIKDGDGDTTTATFTVTLTDTVPGPGGTVNMTVNEAALDTTQGGSDLAAGIATGTNPGLTTETNVVAPASGLSFAANSDALTSVAFAASQGGIVVTGLAAGYSLTWSINGSNQLVGTLHQGATNLGTAVLVALTGDTGATAAGGTAHVGVTATLVGPLADTGAQITINGIDVIATQSDSDTSHGTVNLTVLDDAPTAANDGNLATLDDNATSVTIGTVAGILANDNYGADGQGSPNITIGTGSLGGTVSIVGGNLVYTSAHNTTPGNTDVETFTYTIKDGDGDTTTATFTVSLTDTAPGPGGTVNLTVDEAALDLVQGGSDLAAGISTGTNAASTAETQVVAPASGLSFAANSDALSGVAFAASQGGIVVTGLTAGYSLTWSINGSNQLVGTLHQGATNLGTAVILALTGSTGSTAAGGTAQVGVTATLVGPLSHTGTQITINGIDVVATQVDSDTSHGTVNLTVLDDAPIAAHVEALVTTNSAGSSNALLDKISLGGDGDIDNNYGADGGKTIFTAASVTALTSQNLTSGFSSLNYAISPDGTVLTATKSTDSSVVFTLTLDPNTNDDHYVLNLSQPLDSVQNIDFNNGGYDFVGGNGSWAGFNTVANDNSHDLLLTPIGGGTVNTNANEGGIASGNSVGAGESMRVDFVVDLTGAPVSGGDFGTPADQTQAFEGHYNVNGASAFFTAIPTGDSSVSIKAFDDADTGTLKNVGDGVADTINGVGISYNGASVVVTTSGDVIVGGHTFTVTFSGGIATVDHVVENTRLSGFTATGYNSIEFGYAGGHTFKIGDFGAATISNQPVHFTVPVSITDNDGDTVPNAGTLDITLNPASPPVALDTNHDGHVSYLSADAGVLYDMNGDGHLDHTAWVAPGDSILFNDANHDGTVSGANEFVFAHDGLTDLQALHAAYGDQLDASDAAFSQFGLWNDANSNGVVDQGEVESLTAAGITSISLTSDGVLANAAGGDVGIAGSGSFSYVNDNGEARSGLLQDVALAFKEAESQMGVRYAAATAGVGVVGAAIAALGLEMAETASVRANPHSFDGLAASTSHLGLVQAGTIHANLADAQGARSLLGNEHGFLAGNHGSSLPHGPEVTAQLAAHDQGLAPQVMTTQTMTALVAGTSMPAADHAHAMIELPSMQVLADAGIQPAAVSAVTGGHHTEIVGRILAETIEHDTPAARVLAQLTQGDGLGERGLQHLAASQSGNAVPGWDGGHSGHFTPALLQAITAESMVLHHDAVQPTTHG